MEITHITNKSFAKEDDYAHLLAAIEKVVQTGACDEADMKYFDALVTIAGNSLNPIGQIMAMGIIRQLSYLESSAPMEQVIKSGAIPVLVICLAERKFPLLQHEATLIIKNIPFLDPQHTRAMIAAGALPKLMVSIYCYDDIETLQFGVYAVANIAKLGVEFRDALLQHGAIDNLISVLKRKPPATTVRFISYAFMNMFTVGMPPTRWVKEILSVFDIFLDESDLRTLFFTLNVLKFIAGQGTDAVELISQHVSTSCLPSLAKNAFDSEELLEVALSTMRRIASHNDYQASLFLWSLEIDDFESLANHVNAGIRLKSLDLLLTCLIETESTDDFLKYKILPTLKVTLGDENAKIRKTTALIITRWILFGDKVIITLLLSKGMLARFFDMMSVDDLDLARCILKAMQWCIKNADERVMPLIKQLITLELFVNVQETELLQSEDINLLVTEIENELYVDGVTETQ